MSSTRTQQLLADFCRIRQTSVDLTANLSVEDMVLQSMPDASPSKWHLAHTSWFFEQFVLNQYQPSFFPFDQQFNYLFNSYYEAVGPRHQRPLRGMLSRPSVATILDYRNRTNDQMVQLMDSSEPLPDHCLDLIELGLHHEMQHQELLLMDILHALSLNPFASGLLPLATTASTQASAGLQFTGYDGGLMSLGNSDEGFSYDCEGPAHQVMVQPFALAKRPVTNGEWQEFINDGGYSTPTLWLSEGWGRCQSEGWQAPLYWYQQDNQWFQFGLQGSHPITANEPVCHISYFEADAFARWASARLPREQEWELAAREQPIEGNFMENRHWRTRPCSDDKPLSQCFGDVWEWTQSPFSPYPGFKELAGAAGEYNGKFMCGQFVLRGGSCVTPKQQLRATYRNFFYPHQRWLFGGLRLARDI